MIPVLRVKDGVSFAVIAPSGFRILAALDRASTELGFDLTITSGCDGTHSGPEDPHHKGEAYDVRSKDCPDKGYAFQVIMKSLAPDQFFGWLEDAGLPNEHFHLQQKKGSTYP